MTADVLADDARLRERVEAIAAELQGEADRRSDDSLASVAERSGLLIAVARLRAVLESAPASQGEHRPTEIGNAMGGYDCVCGEPYLTDHCSAAPASQGEEPTDCGCGVPGCVWGHGA